MEKAWDAIGTDPKGISRTGLTYSGHPVACAAGLAALDIGGENLAENARVQGEYLLKQLQSFISKFRCVGDVRGKGLMITIDFVKDKKSREPVDAAQRFSHHVAAIGATTEFSYAPTVPAS